MEQSRYLQLPLGNLPNMASILDEGGMKGEREKERGDVESRIGEWQLFASDIQFARALHRANHILWPHSSAGLSDAGDANERPDFGLSLRSDHRSRRYLFLYGLFIIYTPFPHTTQFPTFPPPFSIFNYTLPSSKSTYICSFLAFPSENYEKSKASLIKHSANNLTISIRPSPDFSALFFQNGKCCFGN